ncbi:MAG: dicarboxylate/amino acid:cation symporter [Rhodobiaceae bacterium]|nr:dicarboxylate/amino acid:cation symporter [Rhodobiaceae bacterium]|tara:strand:- start:3798 stop:5030 length:1233 start_codon:yes stop_codon:yes gene_type:complete
MTLTSKIFTGMIVGFAFGTIISSLELASDNYINTYLIGGILDSGGQIFISLLKLMVVPLVFFSLTSGVSSLDKDMNLGKIAGKTLSLYLFTTAIAITLGLIIAIFLSPGANLNLEISEKVLIPESPSIKEVFINIFPTNPINAMAEGNMLQIIVFSIFVGVALRSLGDKVSSIKEMIDKITEIILKMVFIIINLAPYGVFCLISVLFAEKGFTVLGDLSYYFFIVLSVLIIHALVTYSSLLILFTKINPITFLKKIRPVILFAFSTSSSNATMPITLKTVTENLGVNRKIASFTVPLGATINMDGTAIMQGVATVFIANAYSIDLSLVDYLMVVLTATLASVGTAGVPGVGIIMLAMVLTQVGLPAEGIGLIIGVDRLLDMVRTVVNVTGDSTVSTVIAKSENQLDRINY